MTYPFTIQDEIDVEVAPDDVWRALTDGPRFDSWFMGRNEVESHVGGCVRTHFDGFTMESTITAWEPPTHLAYRGSPDADGAFMGFDWRIEARIGGGSTVHFTHSGRLAGEGAEAEYRALTSGDAMYLRKLGRYLEFFNGRVAANNIAAYGPKVANGEQFWSTLTQKLGIPVALREWDPVSAQADGLPRIDGVVDYLTPEFLGIRTRDGLYRFMHGHDGTVVVEHHDFAPNENGHSSSADAWQRWLTESFSQSGVA